MGKIIILPDEIRNKISAGEVIERPASVVKELIENAIDAEAISIFIEIKHAGKDYIKVSDNGEGMSEEDLVLSIKSHATSKIKFLDDLFNIVTLGFRGEALLAIANVSLLKIISRTRDDEIASFIEAEAGVIKNQGKTAHAVGTTVEVKNLFYNTPARRKFLKSDNTELSHVLDFVTKFALSYPGIDFKFIHNGKILIDLKKEILKERIEKLFPDLKDKIIYVEAESSLFKLKAFLSKPELNYPRRIRQFTFVNGRIVISPLLYHAIDSSYQGLIEGKFYPAVFLFLEINPKLIDINVHPTKREIKFRNEKEIHDLLQGILKDELKGEKVVTTLKITEAEKAGFYQLGFEDLGREGIKLQEIKESFLTYPERLNYLNYKNRYILWLDDEGINIIDQHAGWEKVLFEKFTKAISGKQLEVQRLLLPEVINLNLREAIFLKENLEIFNKLGFEIKEFGENSFVVHTTPIFINKSGKEIIKEVLSEVISEDKIEDKFHKIIASLACHSAIKSGDKLSPQEIDNLITEVKKLDTPYCPHGRPALVLIKWYDLEKQFKRK